MKRTMMAVAVLAAAAPALAAQDEFHWNGHGGPGRRARDQRRQRRDHRQRRRDGQAEVTAVKNGSKSDPAQVKVEVVEHAGGVTICAVYPRADGRENICAPGEGGRMYTRDNDVQVEFRVKVPAGVRFVGRTVNGSITATGMRPTPRSRRSTAASSSTPRARRAPAR